MQKIQSGQIILIQGKKVEEELGVDIKEESVDYKLFFIKVGRDQYYLFCFNDFNNYEFFSGICINDKLRNGNEIFSHQDLVDFLKNKTYKIDSEETIENYYLKFHKAKFAKEQEYTEYGGAASYYKPYSTEEKFKNIVVVQDLQNY